MTEACDHHYHKMCPMLPTVNCYLLADMNDEICALVDFEFCLTFMIIVPNKLQPVSYGTLLFALVNSLFEFCLEFWRMNCWYVKFTVNYSSYCVHDKNDFKLVHLHANDTISISLSIEKLHSTLRSCPYTVFPWNHTKYSTFHSHWTVVCSSTNMPYQSGTNTLYSKHKHNMMCITVGTQVQFDDEKVLEQISTTPRLFNR